jgi:RNA polymerase sigma-70 factor (ECF subfamily)
MARSIPADPSLSMPRELDVGVVYDAEAELVWRCLHRLGVREADLPDLLQEAFVVVHQKRAEYDPARPLRAWLFGICLGLARNYHRKTFRRLEKLSGSPPERAGTDDPERALDLSERRERGSRILSALDPEKRAVFVMFEVEGMSGRAIAELLGVPVGTVHSRLYAARRALAAALAAEPEGEER